MFLKEGYLGCDSPDRLRVSHKTRNYTRESVTQGDNRFDSGSRLEAVSNKLIEPVDGNLTPALEGLRN